MRKKSVQSAKLASISKPEVRRRSPSSTSSLEMVPNFSAGGSILDDHPAPAVTG
jgi:hypothetical protein